MKLSQAYNSKISFVESEAFFLKLLKLKKNSPSRWRIIPPYAGWSIAPMYTKIIYCHTTDIINKCFKFQYDWLNMIRIKQNCTKMYPMSLCQRNLKRQSLFSDVHKNLMSRTLFIYLFYKCQALTFKTLVHGLTSTF